MAFNVYLLLGANLGDPLKQFQLAKAGLERDCGPILGESSVFESPYWGEGERQPNYLNQVVVLETTLEPEQLLEKTQNIEHTLGRVRSVKWAARLIDIDILFVDSLVVNLENLIIPHPLIQARNFVLKPMMELAPDLIHPVFGLSIRELSLESLDTSHVWLYTSIFQEANLTYLEEFTSGDREVIHEIINLFLVQTPSDMAKLVEQVACQNWVEVQAIAHHIKPTLTYVGAESLRELLQSIEKNAKDLNDLDKLPNQVQEISHRMDVLYSDLGRYLKM